MFKTLQVSLSKAESSGDIWFHGRTVPSKEFDLNRTGRQDANDAEGPGFYFTSCEKDARGYSGATGVIIKANLKLRKLTPKKAKMSELSFLIKNAPDYVNTLTNWDENPKKAFDLAVKNAFNDGAPYLQVWIDFYRYSPAEYLKNMVKLGYDGHEATWTKGLRHMIVYNPKAIGIIESKQQTAGAISMKAADLGHGAYLIDTAEKSLILDSQRKNANYGYDKSTKKALTEEEIENFTKVLDGVGVDQVEVTEDECAKILKDIILVHPEVKYIINSSEVNAGIKESIKNIGKNLKKGFQETFDKVFVGLKNKKDEKKRLKEFINENWEKVQKIKLRNKEDEPLLKILEEGLKKGDMTDKELAALTQLVENNPEMLKTLNFTDFVQKFEEKGAGELILFELGDLLGEDDSGLPKVKAIERISELLKSKGYTIKHLKIDLSDDESGGGRIVSFHSTKEALDKLINMFSLEVIKRMPYTLSGRET